MSALATKRAPQHSGPLRQPGAAPRPQLSVVSSVVQARRALPFMVLCIFMLAASMLATVVLNSTMAHRSYEISKLRTELTASQQAEQSARTELEAVTSPSELARAAEQLGMSPSAPAGYITLADQTIVQQRGD